MDMDIEIDQWIDPRIMYLIMSTPELPIFSSYRFGRLFKKPVSSNELVLTLN